MAHLNFMQIKGDFEKMTNNDNEVLNVVKNINNQQDSNVNEEKTEFSKVLLEIEVVFIWNLDKPSNLGQKSTQ